MGTVWILFLVLVPFGLQAAEMTDRLMLEAGIVGGNSSACPGHYLGINGRIQPRFGPSGGCGGLVESTPNARRLAFSLNSRLLRRSDQTNTPTKVARAETLVATPVMDLSEAMRPMPPIRAVIPITNAKI